MSSAYTQASLVAAIDSSWNSDFGTRREAIRYHQYPEISGFSKKRFVDKMEIRRHVEYETERKVMVTAFVQFKLPQPITLEEAQEIFASTAPKYRDMQGLIRKYYLLSEDGGTVGGVYLWKSREDAELLYTDEWRKFVKDTYGAEPTVEYYFSPVIVDNLTGEILKDQ